MNKTSDEDSVNDSSTDIKFLHQSVDYLRKDFVCLKNEVRNDILNKIDSLDRSMIKIQSHLDNEFGNSVSKGNIYNHFEGLKSSIDSLVSIVEKQSGRVCKNEKSLIRISTIGSIFALLVGWVLLAIK